jgi:hypothetical protein
LEVAQSKRVNDWKYRQAAARKRAAATGQRRLYLAKLRQNRHIYLASRKGKERDWLGAKVGLAPKVARMFPEARSRRFHPMKFYANARAI